MIGPTRRGRECLRPLSLHAAAGICSCLAPFFCPTLSASVLALVLTHVPAPVLTLVPSFAPSFFALLSYVAIARPTLWRGTRPRATGHKRALSVGTAGQPSHVWQAEADHIFRVCGGDDSAEVGIRRVGGGKGTETAP